MSRLCFVLSIRCRFSLLSFSVLSYSEICNDDFIEYEMHFLMTCEAYRSKRSEVFEKKINALIVPFHIYSIQEKFIFLMGTIGIDVLTYTIHRQML